MKRAVGVAMVCALIGACGGDPEGDGGEDPSLEDGGGGRDDGGGQPADDAGSKPPRDGGSPGDSSIYVPPPDCGNGKREGSETCDDGNNLDDDGCAWDCTRESGFNCSQATGACASICGDGMLVVGEECDDANLELNDGCGDTCVTEPGWVCLGSGANACTAAACGDGIAADVEACDDGNIVPGDGCSLTCTLEAGWLCGAPGEPCTAARCGDNVRAGSEKCDDGESNGAPKSGDGCTAACDALEANYNCPPLGGACTRSSVCGNGVLTSDEECDDRNTAAGDGCSATCKREPGWQCTSAGQACTATRCGDGIIAGSEQCEDNNSATGDGCAQCKVESGWACAKGGSGLSTCHRAECGDGEVEGEEACDDGNDVVGDGCSPGCKTEPRCQVGQPCQSSCGDGIRLPSDTSEECDDGNLRSGDGCSSQCKKEAGFVCTDVRSELPASFPLTVVYRDFIAIGQNGGVRHPDFEASYSGSDASLGLVGDQLVGGKPVYTGFCQGSPPSAGRNCGGANQTIRQTTSQADFDEWYADTAIPSKVKKVVTTMTMTRQGTTGNYRNPTFGSSLFPLDGKGWVAGSSPKESLGGASDGSSHNFGFTTEIHHWFEFKGGEVLTFSGDDDVWVFIGGKLALDLGGLHPKQTRTITLNPSGTVSCTATSGAPCGGVGDLDLVVGNVYEMALFHAERHTNQSNFDLTLNGFNAPISVCASVCGDGVVTPGEVCDDGSMCIGGSNNAKACTSNAACPGGACTSQNDGSYGRCNASCSGFGPHCGDTVKQSSEQCDLGSTSNNGAYGGCTADCKDGPRCGDGKVDGAYGEQCDLASGNVGGYGGCASTCKLSERCGDAVVQSAEGEQCDDGMNRGNYGGCAPGCVLGPHCGDGVVQTARGEQCDEGADNDGRYGGCRTDCKKSSRCGDRVLDEQNGESCDDGNRNNFDGCSQICQAEAVI